MVSHQRHVGGSYLVAMSAHQQPNGAFNVDANKGHAFSIFMALIGALRASRSGAS